MIVSAPPRVGIYARYSSDLQNPTSTDDQVRLCRDLIEDQFGADPGAAMIFTDAAISGATMERPGLRRLLSAASSGRINLVVTEGLDRLSRNLKDIAGIHEILGYHGVSIWTAHEGKITELHVGLKGVMNSLYLKDMKEKVRRGQSARVAAGFAAASCPYGYRVVRGVVDARGRNVNGIREIDEAEAAVIRRAFEAVANGQRLPDIIEALNADGIPAPGGGLWKRTALAGSPKKREGIIYNEVYIGSLIYNRTRITRDPTTGKRRYLVNPEEEWTRTYVPEMRIVPDVLYHKAQSMLRRYRIDATTRTQHRKTPSILTKHNQHALTGWVKCGWCGGPKSLANESRYLCSTHRYAKKCKNSRGTKEPVLLSATFEALIDRIQTGPDFRERFVQAFDREQRVSDKLRTQADDIVARIDRLMGAVERGVDEEHVSARIIALQGELDQLRQDMREEAPPPLPDEATIRHDLEAAVINVMDSNDIIRQRQTFKFVLGSIVLTPIRNKPRGETIKIELREEGWPEFWRSLSG